MANGQLLVENLYDIGKKKVERVRAAIEPDLVYPLLRGRDVSSWRATPSVNVLLVQDPETRSGIPERSMKRQFPKAFSYLKQFEQQLRERSGFKRYFDDDDPFYSIYNVGPYTLAKWKVVWRDMGSEIQVAVAENLENKVTCPEHHVMAVAVNSQDEAHYLCASLMSSPVQVIVGGYTTTTGISTHVLEHVRIPQFDRHDNRHVQLSDLSKQCHRIAKQADPDTRELARLQNGIDRLAAGLWGVTKEELKAVRDALADHRRPARVAAAEVDE